MKFLVPAKDMVNIFLFLHEDWFACQDNMYFEKREQYKALLNDHLEYGVEGSNDLDFYAISKLHEWLDEYERV